MELISNALQRAQKPIELMCTDKEPCPESILPARVCQSNCALPRTVYEHASSESDKRRIRKCKSVHFEDKARAERRESILKIERGIRI